MISRKNGGENRPTRVIGTRKPPDAEIGTTGGLYGRRACARTRQKTPANAVRPVCFWTRSRRWV